MRIGSKPLSPRSHEGRTAAGDLILDPRKIAGSGSMRAWWCREASFPVENDTPTSAMALKRHHAHPPTA